MYQYLRNVKGFTIFIILIGLWGSLFLTTPQIGLGTALGQTSAGLDFPSNPDVPDGSTVRFKFTDPHLNGLPRYGTPVTGGLTYIWQVYLRQQPGYYTTMFWANDDGAGDLSTIGSTSYYGAHPYPQNPPNGNTHFWELVVEQDWTGGVVEYDRWHIQALRVWRDVDGLKHHEFYWDLPNTDAGHFIKHTAQAWVSNTNPPFPALTWGDAPWAPGNEVWNGILRGIQIYSGLLTTTEMLSEANAPLSTAAGANTIWYLNMNPTPTDISDKSGKGNNPSWVGSERPALYSDTSSSDTTPPVPRTGLQLQLQ